MIGVTYQQIQKYEKGTNKVSAEKLSKICTQEVKPLLNFMML
jgi:transcriptional regulator with XRE-family HTH domain